MLSKVDSSPTEIEMVAKDFNAPANGGNHPWTIESGTISTLLLFNQSEGPQSFNVEISAGGTVWRKRYKLRPMQTQAITINDLIRSGAKDDFGVPFPAGIASGQAAWSVPAKSAGQGRLLQSNSGTAMARSFSCNWQLEVCGGYLGNNYQGEVPVGQTVNWATMFLQTCMNSCYGDPVGSGYASNYGWSSDAPGIAGIASWDESGNILLAGIGSGTTNIEGWGSDAWCTVNIQNPVTTTGCPIPTNEAVNYQRQDLTDSGSPTASDFLQTLATSGNDDGASITEAEGALGNDQCWFSGSGFPAFNSVTGSTWVIGGTTPGFAESQVVVPGHNQWGPDEIGFLPGAVRYYQQNGPKLGLNLPCGTVLFQNLAITCPPSSGDSTQTYYNSNVNLRSTIDTTGITNCREGVCSPHNPYQ